MPGPASSSCKADFDDYLDGFSPNVQDILDKFEFRNQIPRLSKADALGALIEKFLDPAVNLSPNPVLSGDGSVRHAGLDNHAMGTIFEELVRRFNEENNEEAGEHWTPRDAVKLMANLIFLPIADQIQSGTYLRLRRRLRHRRHADGRRGDAAAAGRRARQGGRHPPLRPGDQLRDLRHLPRPTCCSRAKARRPTTSSAARSIRRCPTTPSRSREFDFMLSNPPYGKSWKSDLERMGGKTGIKDPRFIIQHAGDAEYSLLTRSSDGQMLFLANMLSKMKHAHHARQPHRRGPQRLRAVHRRRRPGREQHPPLDHRERLAGSHRRPAAQHVLQHRHRHLHLGAHQPQARAPPRQGPAHRRHPAGSGRCARTSARRTASSPRTTSHASARPSWPSRRPSSRRSSPTTPSATGR